MKPTAKPPFPHCKHTMRSKPPNDAILCTCKPWKPGATSSTSNPVRMKTRCSPDYCGTTTNKSAHSKQPRTDYAMPILEHLMPFGSTSTRSIPPWIRLRTKQFTNQAAPGTENRRTISSASGESSLIPVPGLVTFPRQSNLYSSRDNNDKCDN